MAIAKQPEATAPEIPDPQGTRPVSSDNTLPGACHTTNARFLIDGNPSAGVGIAGSSLWIHAANPLAWDCLSIACLMSGAPEEAQRHQMRAKEIAAHVPIRHFRDMAARLTLVATARNDTVERAAESERVAAADAYRPLSAAPSRQWANATERRREACSTWRGLCSVPPFAANLSGHRADASRRRR